ncbi:uncharacterized protein LOC120277782 [Dioscorea cayenensis subsp. rotundata]|uniref:Uncharacterized protein LOC120277782 n=1 Tax=Dioscorea cayennensis subsp. rotundata TaxID=55577 RepID=A0AB40CKF4_DIOCR|nr:uncharacterized protein LOC120277782 [Dioscorea cayenensis subsp. rotundata]
MRKLQDRLLYRVVDIQHDILCDHGVRLPYKQAWIGKEVAKGILHGNDVASYDLLIWYASKVSETNPGFKRGCRPMLFLDGTHLLGKYGGILLGATAKDVYGEDDYHKIITFISDRSKGLVNAIAKVFPSAPHGYCLRRLQANFLKANGHLGKGLKDECWRLVVKIAYACTSSEYDATVGALLTASTQAHNWLFQKSDMMHWRNYLFRGQRWGEMYSNVAEFFNSWIKEARHLPVCNMVDAIRFKMMNLMYKRRENSMKWETHLCPEIHKKIEKTIEERDA